MNHMELSDELRRQLLESAAWGKAGVQPRLDESASEEVEEEVIEEDEQVEESEAPAHDCPLCTSELHEELDSDAILEHLDVVMALVDRLSQLNEGEEDIDEVIDATLADALFGEDEE